MERKANIISLVVFISIISLLSLLFVFSEDKSFSEQENRDLQTLPSFTVSSLTDGSYSKRINSYFADQFPFRDFFVGVKGTSELALLKNENNGVLLGEDGFLAVRSFTVYDGKGYVGPTDYYYDKVLNAHFAAVRKLQSTLEEQGTEFAIMIPPRILDVASAKFDYPIDGSDRLWEYIANGLDGVNYINILPELRQRLENGEYVYYRTDHHYTTLGAYYAYCEVMRQFGLESDIIPLSDFECEQVSDSFFGTTWSKAGFKFVQPDSVDFYHYIYSDENDFVTEKDGVPFYGFYDRSFLQTKDQYSAFLGGNSNRTTVTKISGDNTGMRPRLIMAKDSFGLSLAPFLALHFDLEIVNVSAMPQLSTMARESGSDYVLIVYNAENLITNRHLAYLS